MVPKPLTTRKPHKCLNDAEFAELFTAALAETDAEESLDNGFDVQVETEFSENAGKRFIVEVKAQDFLSKN